MDDTSRTRVEFPIGTTNTYVTVKEPTDGQRLVLAISRAPKNGDTEGGTALVRRLFRVLEALTGPQWDSVIEDGLINEQFTVMDVVDLIEAVVRFDWAGARTAPGGPDDWLQQAIDREEATQTPPPAPRVVGA